jgi:hypothetical protein
VWRTLRCGSDFPRISARETLRIASRPTASRRGVSHAPQREDPPALSDFPEPALIHVERLAPAERKEPERESFGVVLDPAKVGLEEVAHGELARPREVHELPEVLDEQVDAVRQQLLMGEGVGTPSSFSR